MPLLPMNLDYVTSSLTRPNTTRKMLTRKRKAEREREGGGEEEKGDGAKPKVETREIGTTTEAAASRQNH